jgi:hypothetical protein
MEPLDAPLNLDFKQGLVFPSNVRMIGYVLAGVAIYTLVALNIVVFLLVGLPLLLISCFILLTRYGVKVHPELKSVEEYTLILGFIPYTKKKSFAKHVYISALPSKETTTVYANTYNSTNITEYKYMVTIFGERLRGKLEIAKFENKSLATDAARALAHTMELEYFEYDPSKVRSMMMG